MMGPQQVDQAPLFDLRIMIGVGFALIVPMLASLLLKKPDRLDAGGVH